MSSSESRDKSIYDIESRSHPLSSSIFKIYLKHLHKLCWLIQMRLTCFYSNKKFSEQKFLKNFKKYYLKLFRIEKQKFVIPKFTECFSEFAEYVGKTVGKSGNETIHETNSSSEDSENYKDSGAIPMPAYLKTELFSFGGKNMTSKEDLLSLSPKINDTLAPSVRQSVHSGSRTLDHRIEGRAENYNKKVEKTDKSARTYYQNNKLADNMHNSYEYRSQYSKYPYKRKLRQVNETNLNFTDSTINNNLYLASSSLDNKCASINEINESRNHIKVDEAKENSRYNNFKSTIIQLDGKKKRSKIRIESTGLVKNSDSVVININKNIHNINNVQNYKIEGSYNNISLSQIDREEGTKSQMCSKADKVDNIKPHQRSIETAHNNRRN